MIGGGTGKLIIKNENGYKVEQYEGRVQPFTIWCGPWVVKFCETEDEVAMFLRHHRV